MALTARQVETARPKEKDYKLSDERGLYLLVKTTGARYWRLKYRIAGKEKKLALGVYPDVSLAEARIKRDDARKIISEGGDPGEKKRKEKLRKVRQYCNQIFRYAIATGRATVNPASELTSTLAAPKAAHFPHLRADELPVFLRKLAEYHGSPVTRMATNLLLLTGLRTIELRSAEWSEIDFDNALWTIPESRMKMRRKHVVPLSRQVTDILQQLKTFSGQYRLVFPGRCDINKPMSEASINMVLKRIGYDGRATGHGFRHTMSTILHEQGFNSAWIEMQLAHVDKNSIRGTYNHALYIDGRREMMQWYADYIDSLSEQVS
ncbi:TPA: tyrosine-type recombinase/integrase [Escherichia coli]